MLKLLAVMVAAAVTAFCAVAGSAWAQAPDLASPPPPPRERLSLDRDWRFALGHAHQRDKDFGYGGAAFFFAKAGYGDGPASPKFDDRAWRKLDVPHDWAVEAPFDARASGNHGSKAIGPGFAQSNIGWYRKVLPIGASDQGRRIVVEFDGVYRDAIVWFNGHYIGQEHSGYSSFSYDLTDYVNFEGPNVLVVRADASMEEGWFYEGAGIYRHVWLTKTDPLHVSRWGTFVTTSPQAAGARVSVQTQVQNDGPQAKTLTVRQEVFDAAGRSLAVATGQPTSLAAGARLTDVAQFEVAKARLWSLQSPYLHRLVTTVSEGELIRDRYETRLGCGKSVGILNRAFG